MAGTLIRGCRPKSLGFAKLEAIAGTSLLLGSINGWRSIDQRMGLLRGAKKLKEGLG